MRLGQFLVLLFLFIACDCPAANFKEYRIRLSLDDSFIIQDTKEYAVAIKKQLLLRFANVEVTPQNGSDFQLLLFFKCDTPDLAHFDTPRKIHDSLQQAVQPYLPYVVEAEIVLREFYWKNRHGYLTVLTDRYFMDEDPIPPGFFKYLTKGMVRLSNDSVLGFSLMTNEVGTDRYNRLLAYVKGFVKG